MPRIGSITHSFKAASDSSPSNGFTVIELMIVIAVLAILSGLAVPRFTEQMRNTSVRNVAFQIYADLNRVKTQAIRTQGNCSINFNNPGVNQYTLDNPSRTVNLGDYRGNVAFTGNPDGSFDVFSPLITFTPRGISLASGQVYIINQDNRIYRIQASASGGLSVQRWNGSALKWD